MAVVCRPNWLASKNINSVAVPAKRPTTTLLASWLLLTSGDACGKFEIHAMKLRRLLSSKKFAKFGLGCNPMRHRLIKGTAAVRGQNPACFSPVSTTVLLNQVLLLHERQSSRHGGVIHEHAGGKLDIGLTWHPAQDFEEAEMGGFEIHWRECSPVELHGHSRRLAHRSQVTWQRVLNWHESGRPGQRVRAYALFGYRPSRDELEKMLLSINLFGSVHSLH
jgi:hypothetical protein